MIRSDATVACVSAKTDGKIEVAARYKSNVC